MEIIEWAKKAPYLKKEEERELWQKIIAGDSKSKDKIAASYARFIVGYANRHWRNVPLEDKLSVSFIALMEAMERYDPNKGAFSTFLVFYLSYAIRRYAFMNVFSVPIKQGSTKTGGDIWGMIISLFSETAASPGSVISEEALSALAAKHSLDVSRVRELASFIAFSSIPILAAATDQEDEQQYGLVLADAGQTPEDVCIANDLLSKRTKDIERALSQLDERERVIIEQRYLKEKEDRKTFRELGEIFGVSTPRIMEIEKRAVAKLRKKLRAYEYPLVR